MVTRLKNHIRNCYKEKSEVFFSLLLSTIPINLCFNHCQQSFLSISEWCLGSLSYKEKWVYLKQGKHTENWTFCIINSSTGVCVTTSKCFPKPCPLLKNYLPHRSSSVCIIALQHLDSTGRCPRKFGDVFHSL